MGMMDFTKCIITYSLIHSPYVNNDNRTHTCGNFGPVYSFFPKNPYSIKKKNLSNVQSPSDVNEMWKTNKHWFDS